MSETRTNKDAFADYQAAFRLPNDAAQHAAVKRFFGPRAAINTLSCFATQAGLHSKTKRKNAPAEHTDDA